MSYSQGFQRSEGGTGDLGTEMAWGLTRGSFSSFVEDRKHGQGFIFLVLLSWKQKCPKGVALV